MAKKLIKEIRPYVKLYRDTNNGIAWIEDGSTGLGISVHPNLDKSGSVTGMKKLGYWDKSDRIPGEEPLPLYRFPGGVSLA